jgi:hypothetical protein
VKRRSKIRHIAACKRLWILLLFPIGLALTMLAARFPHVTERVFSRGIYPVMAGFFGQVFGFFRFSIAQFLLIAGIICLIVFLVRGIRGIVRAKGERGFTGVLFAVNILCVAAIIFTWFTLTSGLNYHRETFAQYAGLDVRPSSVEELEALSVELVDTLNAIRAALPEDERGVVLVEQSFADMAQTASGAFAPLAERYTVLGGYTPRPKPVMGSRLMSYLNIVGIYSPFTFEANINTDIPAWGIPSTMMHELAHFKGFMREDEANFIAFIACRASDDPIFRYSGYMMAMIYTTNALHAADRERHAAVMGELSEGVLRDIRANREYWRQFETPVAEISTAVNNIYLRANLQQDGVRSYGMMVDLLLAERRERLS